MTAYAIGRHRAPGRLGGLGWAVTYLVGFLYLGVSLAYLVVRTVG